MTRVKICGVTTLDDALMCAEAGAAMIGLNFYSRSRRYIAPATAATLCDALRDRLGAACPVLVGVFVNEAVGTVSAITRLVGLDAAQLHGDESAEMLAELRGIAFKAIRPMNQAQADDDARYYAATIPADERLPSLLVDAYQPGEYGGTGHTTAVEIALALAEMTPRLMLAGGLTPDNVGAWVQTVRPWGVDVASGVESGVAGVKDAVKVRAFIEQVSRA